MKVIKIKKSGKIFLDEINEEMSKSKKISSLKEYLSCEVEFEDGLTFGTFFKIILKEKEFFDILFAQELNGRKLADFEKKLSDKPQKMNEDFEIMYLEVSKFFEFFTFDKGSTINLFSVFMGIGHSNDGFDVLVPISLFSICELKDFEIAHNNIVEVYREIHEKGEDEDEDEDEDEVPVEPNKKSLEDDEDDGDEAAPIFEAFSKITLYETIQSILYEISYYKTDEDRMLIRKSQNDAHINFSKIEILKAQLQKLIDNEEYEKAATTKRELDKILLASSINKN